MEVGWYWETCLWDPHDEVPVVIPASQYPPLYPARHTECDVAIARSPLFTRLPQELRHMVYGYVLPTETAITMQDARPVRYFLQQLKWFTFLQHKAGDSNPRTGTCSDCHDLTRCYSHPHRRVESGLFSVSRAVYNESFPLFLEKNDMVFESTDQLLRFAAHFSDFMIHVKSVVLHFQVDNSATIELEQETFRDVVRSLPGAEKITIYGSVRSMLPWDFKCLEHGALSYVLPSARLRGNTATACLHDKITAREKRPGSGLPEDTTRGTEVEAHRKLSQDANLLEEEQVEGPEEQQAALNEWRRCWLD